MPPTSCTPKGLRALAAAAMAAAACGGDSEPLTGLASEAAQAHRGPPGAKWDLVEMLREDLVRARHPSDGGGRAWLEHAEGDSIPATAGAPGRFTIVFEVGPQGIAKGGMIYLQVSPFWEWSTPQVEEADFPGYTVIEVSADDIEIGAGTLDRQLLGIEVQGRPLEAGEQIRVTFGAGSLGAVADRFAEKNSRFWISVDGDGDGSRWLIADSPGVDVVADSPTQLRVTLPSIARPGEVVRVTVALLDAEGNAGYPATGEVVFEEVPSGLEVSGSVALEAGDGGHKTVEAVAREPGVFRLRARGPGGLEAESNPLVVTPTAPRILWGDLQGHSGLSDGTGTAEDYFLYARDVAGLDVVALTDHDHWGIEPLSATPGIWEEIKRQTRRFYQPGRFVTVLGYEWTSWIHGHRHVLYFEDEGEVFSSLDPDYESPLQLWKALEGRKALTFAHHSAGGPIQTNWDIPPDPAFEPVTEIVSVHGSSEALDSPGLIYSPVQGNFVRDALDRGYRFGFVGSSDGHDGHPGLSHLAATSGGLAAIFSEERTREGVLAALRARQVYATNGARMVLRVALGAHRMGSTIAVPESGSLTDELFVRVVATAPLAGVELIRSGSVVDAIATEGYLDIALQRTVEDLRPGEYLYVRALQEDGGAAWSSPFFLE